MTNIEQAYYNSYRLITGKVTYNDLVSEGTDDLLLHDHTKEPNSDIIHDIIEYYSNLDQYKKCAELKIILDKK
ncbi:MAG: hypothetical protein HRT87_08405 [Legionellales bacterium]|nr:hypothetical protein [Legionellales bacterium]